MTRSRNVGSVVTYRGAIEVELHHQAPPTPSIFVDRILYSHTYTIDPGRNIGSLQDNARSHRLYASLRAASARMIIATTIQGNYPMNSVTAIGPGLAISPTAED